MLKSRERIATIFVDFLSMNTAFIVFYLIRAHMDQSITLADIPLLTSTGIALFYWLIIFAFFGLYRLWYVQLRIDEVLTRFRATLSGVLVLFFLMLQALLRAGRTAFSVLHTRILGHSRCVCNDRSSDSSCSAAAIIACRDRAEEYTDYRMVGKSVRIMQDGTKQPGFGTQNHRIY